MQELVLLFVLAESALETVPKELLNHPATLGVTKRRGIIPKEMMLDRSYHHKAMIHLKNSKKRGRPDIVHITLLEVLGAPLNKGGLLKTYIHTINDYVIEVSPEIRLPKNYNRFVGLIEQLFKFKKVPKEGDILLSLYHIKLEKLIKKLNPSKILIFSTVGKLESVRAVAEKIAKEKRPLIIIGGFPHGNFSKETLKLADDVISISNEALEASIVASRIIYEYEVSIGLT